LAYFRPLAFRDVLPMMQDWWQGNAQGILNENQNFYFQAPRPVEERYDTQADPWETTN
jgi:N-sulfoglucosamine sulfohydrolase